MERSRQALTNREPYYKDDRLRVEMSAHWQITPAPPKGLSSEANLLVVEVRTPIHFHVEMSAHWMDPASFLPPVSRES